MIIAMGYVFTIYSDHKPLEGLFGEEKPTSGTSISRIKSGRYSWRDMIINLDINQGRLMKTWMGLPD